LIAALNAQELGKRILVSFDDLPRDLANAVLAIEDKRFFEHRGIDFIGILRALRENIKQGEIVQGGSTITQQLVKDVFLTRQTLWRKLKEAYLALILELKLRKEEIFTLYCNEIYLGQSGRFSIQGLGQAARDYFGKDISQLILSEAALLAGLIQGPNRYSPYKNRDQAIARRNTVLDAMVEMGAIAKAQAEEAKSEGLKLAPPRKSADETGMPYFIDYVKEYLDKIVGADEMARISYRIYTTIDVQLQQAAHQAVTTQLKKLDEVFAKQNVPPGPLQAALVALDVRTGEVLAMVGGRSYADSQLNRATDANRQMGSAFKPFVYAAAFNEGRFTPVSRILDAPKVFYSQGEEYAPGNYGNGYSNREVTLREALVRSLNIVTVDLAQQAGLYRIAEIAERAGLPRPPLVPSIALGASQATPLEVASAYASFANGGLPVAPRPVRLIHSAGSESSYWNSFSLSPEQTRSRRVFSPQIAYLMTDIMKAVINEGTAASVRALGFNKPAAGKTGTSHDGWFVGYTPALVCVVWVGFDDNRELGLTGAQSALPIWVELRKKAIAIRPELGRDDFPVPGGITFAQIDPVTGLLASEYCLKTRKQAFISGTEPKAFCSSERHSIDIIVDSEEPEIPDRPTETGKAPSIWDN